MKIKWIIESFSQQFILSNMLNFINLQIFLEQYRT